MSDSLEIFWSRTNQRIWSAYSDYRFCNWGKVFLNILIISLHNHFMRCSLYEWVIILIVIISNLIKMNHFASGWTEQWSYGLLAFQLIYSTVFTSTNSGHCSSISNSSSAYWIFWKDGSSTVYLQDILSRKIRVKINFGFVTFAFSKKIPERHVLQFNSITP